MAVSSFAGGSNYRRRTPTNSRRRVSASQRRRNFLDQPSVPKPPVTTKPPAPSPTTDPLTNVLSQQQQMMLAQGGGAAPALSPQEQMAASQGAGGSMNPQQASGSTGAGFDDTVTPTGVNTDAQTAFQEQTGGKVAGSTPANLPPPPPPPPPPAPTMAQMQAPQTQNNPLPQGGMTSEQYQQVLRMNNQPTGNAFDPNAGNAMALAQAAQSPVKQPFDDTVTPTGISTEVDKSRGVDLPSMADAQGGGAASPQPSMADAQGTGQAPALSPQEQMAMAQQGIIDPITQALSGATSSQQAMFDAQNQQLGNISNTLSGVTAAQQAMFDAQNQRFTDAISGSTDAQQAMFDAQNQRFTDAISGSTDAQRAMFDAQNRGFTDAISGATDAQRQMFEAQNQQLGGISGILEQQLAMQQAQQAQADQQQQAQLDMEAAQRAQNEQQAQLDMQRAQRINDRTRDLLSGYGGGTPAQREMMIAQAPTFQQQQLLRRAESRLQAPSGATDAQAAMFAAQTPTELPDVTGFRSPYADAAVAQGGDITAPTTYRNPYADAAAQQPDTGLRTADGRPQFQPRMPQLGRLANPGGNLQQRLEQEYLGRIDSANDPILASQIADQQLRQQEAQQGLVEQLSRYGVLRGGGDTAAALTRMAEGNERNRLALEAAAAQRRQGDLRDALAFDQARSSMNIAQRGQGLEERLAADRLLDTALARDVTRAGQTGQFQGVDTLAAQEQRQRMNIAERGQTLEEQLAGETIQDRQQGRDIAAAELTGRFGDANTLAGRELALREDLSRRGDLRAQQAAESELFGRVITGAEAPITTLEGQRAASDLDTAGLAREATEAGLTGQFRGGDTTAERALESQLASDDLARQIQEAGVTGQYGGEDTLQSQVIESSLQNEALNRGLARAGATGLFREEGDTGAGTETLESRLRTAGLTGRLDDDITLAGRQAEQDLIGSILAASDPELEGRTDALAEALTRRLGEDFGPTQDEIVNDIQEEFEQVKENTDADSPLDRIRQYLEIARKYEGSSVSQALLEVLQSDKSAAEKAREAEAELENIGLARMRDRTQRNRST